MTWVRKCKQPLRWPEKLCPQQLLVNQVHQNKILIINQVKGGRLVESDDNSDTEDVINPLVDQELYIYDCYAVDITDGHHNTKTSIKTCPIKNQCYCGQQFASSDEFKTHEEQHTRQAWTCFECDKKSKDNDKCAV